MIYAMRLASQFGMLYVPHYRDVYFALGGSFVFVALSALSRKKSPFQKSLDVSALSYFLFALTFPWCFSWHNVKRISSRVKKNINVTASEERICLVSDAIPGSALNILLK